ncbi:MULTISPECIES: energy transducer TonB [unclassified Flammeovirga]|uniref:energy transducer TonB n=1 Tax=unclassified Flammeovirga TaxID=2637820 RepID=UPI0005C472E0|nr:MULTISPECIES: energy transducer TonB [unclassified Flammeovirga]MBD0400954.1 TonB family protein [Flammeovirga sp. EKP202]
MNIKNILLSVAFIFGLVINVAADNFDDDKPLFTYQQAKVVNYEEITSQIDYPKVGKDLGIEGQVKIKAYVNAEGEVTKYTVIKGSEMLASSVEEAIMKLEFEPTVVTNTITGEVQAVPSWVIVPFNFSLNY